MDQRKNSQAKITAIIPARYRSSRFPGKPLAMIAGRPMVQHVYEQAARVALIGRVTVATDDVRIADAVRAFGGEVVMTRADHLSGTDRLAEAAGLLGIPDDDVVLNIQGDQPVFAVEAVEELARRMSTDPALPMGTLVCRMVGSAAINDPNHVKAVFDRRGRALYFSRAAIPFARDPQEMAQASYYKHVGIYAYRRRFLDIFVTLPEGEWERQEKLEQLRALENGYTIQVVLTEHDSVEVDRPEDLAKVEEMLRNLGRL